MSKSRKNIKWPTTWSGWLMFAVFAALLYWLNDRAEVVPPSREADVERSVVRCVDVIDGDTLDVMLDGKRERIRLLGIDCMDSYNESKQAQQAKNMGLSTREVARWSKEAGAWLRQRTLRQDVVLVFNLGTPRRGGYDRLLCYVEHDGVDVCLEQLKKGLAESRREPHSRKVAYDKAARQAKAARLGIWSGR